uniref:BY PROTMAP: gi/647400084/emb/CDR45189.1/ RHTO0S10e06480g1_1 [Rhodosporidium toruloides] n=1 Tax=Rhodotorula toruloides TaxID=5286 RepID=A0A0K3CEK7_RHOTO
MTGSTDADAADADTLPFQLPPSSYSSHTPTRQPPTPKPAHTATQRKPARSRSFQGVYIPARPASDHQHRSRAHNDPSSSSPLMGRPKHDGAPTASSSRRADSSADRGESKSLPWLSQPSPEPPAACKGAYGTRSGGNGRSNSLSQASSAGSGSLKIVLRPAKPDPSAASTLPTPSSSASPPVVPLESSVSTSEASSRSESPAAVALATDSHPPARSFPPSQTPELGSPAPSSSGASTPRPGLGERSSSRKGNKNGKDGLNRVCHHHKSQTDRPRMTCVNAPECKTVWCKTCVEKYYLACTPNAAFEAGVLFNCPVCQDACQCAGCKRKRRGYTRDGRRAPVDGDVTVPVSGGTKEKKAKKEKRGRENANVEVGLWAGTAAAASASGWEAAGLGLAANAGPVPGAEEEDSTDDEADAVSRMLMGGVSVSPAVSTAPLQPAPAPAEEVPVIKRRSSLTSAYDRANPLTFAHMPPPAPVVTTPAPAPPAPASRRRSGAASRPPRQPDPYANLSASLPASFASTPTAAVTPTAASSRPRRNKRPSSAFDDYALDLPTSSAAGLVDRNNATPISQYAYATSGSAARRRGGPAVNSRQHPSGIEALASLQPRRKIRRRWHSGISSASSCDDLSMSEDDLDDDSMDEGEASMMVVEEPLPVLAGLERNLGLEGDGTPPDGMLFGEVFGVVGVADPALAGALAGGAAVQLDPATAAAAKPLKPKVKWIKGPQRKKWEMARAAEAAAAMGSSTTIKEEPKDDKVPDSDASKQPTSPVAVKREALSVSPSDPIKPFGSPSEPPKRSLTVPITASDEDSPPSYDSHHFVSRQAAASNSTSAPPSTSAQPAQSAAQSSPSRAALASRSPDDARLAFALLDAVRAAVGPRTSESASTTSAEPDPAATASNFGAALEAALGSNGSTSALSSPSKAPFDARGPASSGGSLGSAMDVDDYEAREREAERRRQQQAAQAVVDPGKAFKPTAKDDTQLFVGSPVCDVDDEAEDATMATRQAGYAGAAGIGFDFDMLVAVDQDLDAPTPVDDLWTPASAADSLSTTPSTAASSAMPTSAPFDEPACSVAPSASLAAEYPFFAAAVVSGITPLPGTPMRDLSGLSGLELEVGVSANLDKAMWADDLAAGTDSQQAVASYLASRRTVTHATAS